MNPNANVAAIDKRKLITVASCLLPERAEKQNTVVPY